MCDTDILNRICLISKLLESTLIVFIDEGDEEGAEIADELERLNLLSKDNCCRLLTTQKLAVVKILSGSESSRYFSDIYGPVKHSAIFFIKSTTGEVLHMWNGRGRTTTESPAVAEVGEDPTPPVVEPSSSGLQRRICEEAVLQLRVADGSATTMTFPRGATLAVVRDAVVRRLQLPVGSFSIVNPYPRYEFGETDFRRTLDDLRLCPNAVLFIFPNSEATAPKPWVEPFSAFVGLVMNMFTGIWDYLRTTFIGPKKNDRTSRTAAKRRKKRSARIQSRRNVHSLHDADSSSEDNATYNGNSTQQQ